MLRGPVSRNYLLLGASVATGLVSNLAPSLAPRAVPSLEPWLSVVSLALLAAAAIRVLVGGAAGPAAPTQLRHYRTQRWVMLLFLIAGVTSTFQWVLYFKYLYVTYSLNVVLQMVTVSISLSGCLLLGLGMIRLVRERFPAATSRPGRPTPPPPGG